MAVRAREHTELPIPNGWFAVAWSKDLVPGDVRAIHYFGEDLVLFRSRSGQARVLDAYCVHLGAHLGAGGRVMGETIRCPFHGWQYDGESGKCVAIPYCEHIPERARVRTWPVQEKNGMIFAWFHSRGEAPSWDFPEIPELVDPEWSAPRTFEVELPAHVQDTHENNNDPVHFHFVHGMLGVPESEISFADDGRTYRTVSHQEQQTPFGTFKTSLVRESWGLGLVAIRTVGIPDAGLLLYSSTTPIESNRVMSRWLLTATSNMVDIAGEEFMKGVTEGVMSDMPIWRNKVHRAKPVFCAADRYLAEFRKWARQFYSDPL
jgi:nitrite reductase/ring-hydroxylating ferredoxin subunit